MPKSVSDALSRPVSHPLAYVRLTLGMTQVELAKRISRRLGCECSKKKIGRWEGGRVEPEIDAQHAMAAEFGVPPERLRTHLWPKWLPTGDSFVVDRVWTADSCHALLDSTVGGVMLDRRGFVTLSVGSAAVLADRWSAAEPLPAIRGGGTSDVLRSVETRLVELRDMEDRHGGGRVRALVNSELRFTTELLRDTGLRGAVAARLFGVSAELCRIAGWASLDSGYLAASERYFALGLRAASAGGDALSGANLLKCLSLLLVEEGRPAEALALAQAAVHGTADGPARVRAMLMVRQARLHATLADRSACEKSLSAAETLMSRDEGGRPFPDWAAYFDAAEYAAQVAACYLALGSHQMSDRWLETALAMQPSSRERDGTTYRLWRAENAVREGRVDEAIRHLSVAAPVVHRGYSLRNLARFKEVRVLMRPHRGLPQVRDLDEQVASLVA